MSELAARPRYSNPYLAGAGLGLVLFLSFLLTGHGLGASGGVGRIIAAVQSNFSPEHVDRNPYLAGTAGGDRDPLDHWILWEVAGVLVGGFISGLLAGRLKVETRRGPSITNRRRWLYAVIGGTLVGFGARLARGCTSGQALSGGATLAVGSWAFMFSVFAAGYLLAYPVRRLWN